MQTIICVVDGRDEVRQVVGHTAPPEWPFPTSSREYHLAQPMPALQDNERVEYVLGDIRPYIIKTA